MEIITEITCSCGCDFCGAKGPLNKIDVQDAMIGYAWVCEDCEKIAAPSVWKILGFGVLVGCVLLLVGAMA